jgi:hypothetical protein
MIRLQRIAILARCQQLLHVADWAPYRQLEGRTTVTAARAAALFAAVIILVVDGDLAVGDV